MPKAHTTVAQSLTELEKLAPLWNRLFQAQGYSMFQSYRWNRLAAEIFADRFDLVVVAVESEKGAAILPAAFNQSVGRIELLGEELFDYRDVLHTGDCEVLRAAWQRLAGTGMPFSVNAIEASGERDHWRDFPLRSFANAPEVLCDRTTERQFRSTHRRLDRQLRRIQQQTVTLRVYTGGDSAVVQYLYNCKAEQFVDRSNNLFRDPRRRRFMVEVAAGEGQHCEIFTLQSEDEILIAGLVTFRDKNYRRFYTVYFDPAWADYSPGILLVYEATACSLGEGLHCDYMTGEYPYKMRFANALRPLYKVDITAEDLVAITKNVSFRSVA